MSLIPKELTAPLNFLVDLENLHLSESKLSGWKKISDNFELVSELPNYKPVAKVVVNRIADAIARIREIKKSQFNFPSLITEFKVEDAGFYETYDEETQGLIQIPDLIVEEIKRPITDEDKNKLWNEFHKAINEFKLICNKYGYSFDLSLPFDFIEKLAYLKIDHRPFVDYASKDNFINAMSGELANSALCTLKIQLSLTLAESVYVLYRLKSSGKVPIINQLVDKGVFWKAKKLSWLNMRSDKSKFVNDPSKLPIRTEIDSRIDSLLKLI